MVNIIINRFFQSGHARSKNLKKNIIASFFIKILNILIGIVLVPITIEYLNPMKYGIWMTLSSVISWIGFFDIGLGNGLRNRFTEAKSRGDFNLLKTYISTTYSIVLFLMICVLGFFVLINPYLKWNQILNIDPNVISFNELSLLALLVILFFCSQMVIKLISTILIADQKPAISSFLDLISKIIILLIIFLISRYTSGSLMNVAVTMGLVPIVILGVCSVWYFFYKDYKEIRPSLKFLDFKKAPDLLNLGVKFFFIQISAILLYQSNNLIIAHLFGPEQVTPYNIAFRYFYLIQMGFSIIITPFWSAFTEAWVKGEKEWIKSKIRKLIQFWFLTIFICFIMLLTSESIYIIWIGEKIKINFSLSIFVSIWTIINAWNSIFSHFVNGVGKIKLQLNMGVIAAFINVPLSIILGRKFGIEGILFSNIILSLGQAVLIYIQYYKIINLKAVGFWNE